MRWLTLHLFLLMTREVHSVLRVPVVPEEPGPGPGPSGGASGKGRSGRSTRPDGPRPDPGPELEWAALFQESTGADEEEGTEWGCATYCLSCSGLFAAQLKRTGSDGCKAGAEVTAVEFYHEHKVEQASGSEKLLKELKSAAESLSGKEFACLGSTDNSAERCASDPHPSWKALTQCKIWPSKCGAVPGFFDGLPLNSNRICRTRFDKERPQLRKVSWLPFFTRSIQEGDAEAMRKEFEKELCELDELYPPVLLPHRGCERKHAAQGHHKTKMMHTMKAAKNLMKCWEDHDVWRKKLAAGTLTRPPKPTVFGRIAKFFGKRKAKAEPEPLSAPEKAYGEALASIAAATTDAVAVLVKNLQHALDRAESKRAEEQPLPAGCSALGPRSAVPVGRDLAAAREARLAKYRGVVSDVFTRRCCCRGSDCTFTTDQCSDDAKEHETRYCMQCCCASGDECKWQDDTCSSDGRTSALPKACTKVRPITVGDLVKRSLCGADCSDFPACLREMDARLPWNLASAGIFQKIWHSYGDTPVANPTMSAGHGSLLQLEGRIFPLAIAPLIFAVAVVVILVTLYWCYCEIGLAFKNWWHGKTQGHKLTCYNEHLCYMNQMHGYEGKDRPPPGYPCEVVNTEGFGGGISGSINNNTWRKGTRVAYVDPNGGSAPYPATQQPAPAVHGAVSYPAVSYPVKAGGDEFSDR